jgi:hypothetical protein
VTCASARAPVVTASPGTSVGPEHLQLDFDLGERLRHYSEPA